ncbi:carotenoid biosynthesis protein [Nocardia puris]|uniref:Putative membrane protein n=1 Tax=Nocardia puris TaxID=208602 RepID=A0A366DLS8_9NOCA|nr:carotenoid biosynthesis protein [Nocardia puris]RBO90188.1 putative membrane protein [Nocardia puris]
MTNVSLRDRVAAARRDLGHPVPVVFAALLVLTQIAYPLTEGAARDRVTVLVVLLFAGTALAHAIATRGFRYAAGFLVIVSGTGLLAELLGTATDMPFGCYSYAEGRIGPELAGVPLVVSLAWTGGVYPVWVVAGLLTRRTATRVPLAAVGTVGWDLFLDPQMVADGQWSWCDTDSGLPGLAQIPLTNYLGWLVVALLMAALLAVWEHAAPAPTRPRESSATAVPVLVFLWTWLGSTLAHALFLDLPASAAYGFLGMGLLGVPLLSRMIRLRAAPPDQGQSPVTRPAR